MRRASFPDAPTGSCARSRAFGLAWDGAVEYQSARTRCTMQRASRASRPAAPPSQCSCSRREREGQSGYPGTCRKGPTRAGPTATRFRVDDVTVSFEDRAQGVCTFALRERGDVVVRRRDGAFAYQLAVVVDDALQGVTDVVRGADLLDSTPWQLALQRALALAQPRLPAPAADPRARWRKARKITPFRAARPGRAGRQLYRALRLLRQEPPAKLELEPAPRCSQWACAHWRPERLQGPARGAIAA